MDGVSAVGGGVDGGGESGAGGLPDDTGDGGETGYGGEDDGGVAGGREAGEPGEEAGYGGPACPGGRSEGGEPGGGDGGETTPDGEGMDFYRGNSVFIHFYPYLCVCEEVVSVSPVAGMPYCRVNGLI